MPSYESSSTLRSELELAIRTGRCVYCRRPASPERPLTREHVIPRARGGTRKDVRIIVPACAGCNQRRGCRELVLFLLIRPRRISAFLDYLSSLSPESIRHLDPRVFAELYAAVWMLSESVGRGAEWRTHLQRLCSGRTLHRRRYAARRLVGAVGGRMESLRERAEPREGPSCPIPEPGKAPAALLDESLEKISARLVGILSLAWQAPAHEVRDAITRQHRRGEAAEGSGDEGSRVVDLDGWKGRSRRRRMRVDRRGGRRARGRAA